MIALNITHGDDNAVAVLAMAMVSKLAQARAKGRSGWDTAECTQQHLSDLLREHVAKGDPVDVANFCAFLTARGEGIAGAAPAAFRPGKPGADVEVAWLLMRSLAGDGEGGSDETDTVVLALRADDEQWFVAGDWRANSALDYVHHDGGWIVGWMPYEVPAARLSAAPQAPAAPVPPAATMFHDAGAIAQCTCGRYTLDRNSLSPRDDRRPVCECGTNHGWSGSFKKPGADSKWHGTVPAPEAAPAAPAVDALDAVRQAVRDYHYDLDMRRHGDIAACNAIDAIQAALGMAWTQGAEAAARAAQAATTGQPAK